MTYCCRGGSFGDEKTLIAPSDASMLALGRDKRRARGAGDLLLTPLFYLIGVLLVLLSNTLFGRLEGNAAMLKGVLLGAVLAATLAVWLRTELRAQSLGAWLLWCGLLFAVYASVALHAAQSGGRGTVFLFAMLAIAPLSMKLLIACGAIGRLLAAFVNVVLVLAIVSVVLWLAGPIAGILQPNCSIANNWNGLGVMTYARGYYDLLYVTQHQAIGSVVVVRNTGIFTEAPIYSYVLCVALLFESMFVERPRKFVVVVLVVTVLSTFSSTGYLLLIMLVLVTARGASVSSRFRGIRTLLFVVLAVAGVAVGWQILAEKLASSSGMTRVDDFAAGLAAWLNNPLLGNGFGSGDLVKEYMSGFRSNNLGFSNSPMAVLARGGVAFMLPFLVGFAGLVTARGREARICGWLFVYLWTVTVVWSLPLTVLVIGLGVADLMGCVGSRRFFSWITSRRPVVVCKLGG